MATFAAYNLDKIRNPEMRQIIETVMDITTGHDHDGTNSKAAVAGTVADGAISYAKCDAGVKASLDLADSALQPGEIALANLDASLQASIALADSALQPGEIELAPGTPVNAKAATGTLTISGVVIDGETVTIGADVYEFCADTAQSLTAGSTVAVDITSYATASQGTLTVAVNPTVGDTMTIGDKLFTFVPLASANGDGDIGVGLDLAATKLNIVAAINGTDGHNTANDKVSAAAFGAADACVITALVGGVAGNLITSTGTFTAGTNIFDAATLGTTTAGVDCIAANAVTALVASITANDTQGVGAANGAGDTVVLTADVKGTAGNSIATTEAMANGAFGAATLEGGSAGTVGTQWQTFVDSSYLYVCIAENTVNDANWRRISLGTVY